LVIPCHNEAATIAGVVSEAKYALYEAAIAYEIVVVDDGSDDATSVILEELSRTDLHLLVLHHRRRRGKSAALRTGVIASRSQWIATMDGDWQDDPHYIPRLLDAARRSDRNGTPVLVCGVRLHRQESLTRRAITLSANHLSALLLGHDLTDMGGGMKVFRRDAYLALPAFDGMHRFLPALFGLLGGGVVSLPVIHRRRLHGVSHYKTRERAWAAAVDFTRIIWIRASRRGSTTTPVTFPVDEER
jgi:dolichol-phosphate mannosyltransferase